MVVENFKENGDTKMAKKSKPKTEKFMLKRNHFTNVYGLSCWQ